MLFSKLSRRSRSHMGFRTEQLESRYMFAANLEFTNAPVACHDRVNDNVDRELLVAVLNTDGDFLFGPSGGHDRDSQLNGFMNILFIVDKSSSLATRESVQKAATGNTLTPLVELRGFEWDDAGPADDSIDSVVDDLALIRIRPISNDLGLAAESHAENDSVQLDAGPADNGIDSVCGDLYQLPVDTEPLGPVGGSTSGLSDDGKFQIFAADHPGEVTILLNQPASWMFQILPYIEQSNVSLPNSSSVHVWMEPMTLGDYFNCEADSGMTLIDPPSLQLDAGPADTSIDSVVDELQGIVVLY